MIYQRHHSNISSSLKLLINILENLGRYEEILDHLKQHCEFIEHHQGMNHPDALKYRNLLHDTRRRFQKQL